MPGERLQGLVLILIGCGGLALLYVGQQNGWLSGRPPMPAGMPPVPLISPLACLNIFIGIGSLGLCLIGVRKLLNPDDWNPPKHLG